MYCVLVLLGTLLAVSADGHYGVTPPHTTYAGVGYAVDETPKPYQFAYQAEAIGGASTRQETADGSGAVAGSYTLSDEDGRKRVVEYVADGAGFRASVNTNEPGTKSESPADVSTVSEAVHTPVSHVAPASYGAAYQSPYHYGAYGSLGYGSYPYGAYSGVLGYGRYSGGLSSSSPYYGGALRYGSHYSGRSQGYGGRYHGGLPCGGRCHGGALGHGSLYYGGIPCGGRCQGRPLNYGAGYYGKLPCGGRCREGLLGHGSH